MTRFLLWTALWICAGLILRVQAAPLMPPRSVVVRDSLTIQADKGVEFFRGTQAIATTISRGKLAIGAAGFWRTDWQTPEDGRDRIRQDGRWYGGLSRSITGRTAIWLAASGEHFDDRPFHLPAARVFEGELTPRTPDVSAEAVEFVSQGASAVRLLRGGGGASIKPVKPLQVHVGIGSVEDRRIGTMRSGFGLWSQALLDDWTVSGFDQSASVSYNLETPRDHQNDDITAAYSATREFAEGTTNQTSVAAGWLGRDIYLEGTGGSARREERYYRVRDALNYAIGHSMRIEAAADVQHKQTEQSQSLQAATQLEENQAGFSGAVEGQYRKAAGRMEIGLRSVSQTIRGDILQGLKSDLGFRGRIAAPWRSTLSLHLGVAKYTLDTRSQDNNDDRDELRYTAEGQWSKAILPSLRYELQGTARLDHLVYLFSENSANNRWTRFFLAGVSMRHQPGSVFRQTVQATVSATYQDYDFETNSRAARSTVYRRMLMSDSAAVNLSDRWALSTRFGIQVEEFGRLFWDSFEEERSDEIRSSFATLDAGYRIQGATTIGGGFLWDGRKGKRFGDASKSETYIFQRIESFGPTLHFEHNSRHGFFLSGRWRALKQSQLDHEDRWIIAGETVGGLRW